MNDNNVIQVIFHLYDPELTDEELQSKIQYLLPQLRDVDGVEEVGLVTIDTIPDGTKSLGGFLIGTFHTTVELVKLRPIWQFLGDRFADKTLEATFKAPDGREFTAKAKNREDFEYLRQQAEEFFNK